DYALGSVGTGMVKHVKTRRYIGTLSQQAREWIENDLPTAAEREAFAGWIRRSPLHLQEFLEQLALEQELENLDASHHFDLDRLIGEVANLKNVVPLPNALAGAATTDDQLGDSKRLGWPVRLPWKSLWVAGVALLFIVGWQIVRHFQRPAEYVTAT